MVQPTANRPLTGFETITGHRSAILGHPKIELVSIPTPQSRLPKLLLTTGACTVPNYTRSKAGKKGEFHHSYGAVVVETDGALFHVRHLNALQDGSFIDLNWAVSPDGVTEAPRAEALVTGDSHAVSMDPEVRQATYEGPSSILSTLHPKRIVWHDVLDFRNRNHHETGNPIQMFKRWVQRQESVEEELRQTLAVIDSCGREGVKNIVVRSNHDEALERWLREAGNRHDPVNARFYHECMAALYGTLEKDPGANVNMFDFWARRWLKSYSRTRFLQRDEPCIVKGVELGYHGDAGPNGARGTSGQFTKIGVKTIVGHAHSPAIRDGVYQVGTSSKLRMGYNKGPSSWLHTHCVLYANGKRALIHVIRGKWRAA
jgi:hypothetical protein